MHFPNGRRAGCDRCRRDEHSCRISKHRPQTSTSSAVTTTSTANATAKPSHRQSKSTTQHRIRPSHSSNCANQPHFSDHPVISLFSEHTDPQPCPGPATHSQPDAVRQTAVSAGSAPSSTPDPTYLHRIQSDQTITASETWSFHPRRKTHSPRSTSSRSGEHQGAQSTGRIPGDQQRFGATSTAVERAANAESRCCSHLNTTRPDHFHLYSWYTPAGCAQQPSYLHCCAKLWLPRPGSADSAHNRPAVDSASANRGSHAHSTFPR